MQENAGGLIIKKNGIHIGPSFLLGIDPSDVQNFYKNTWNRPVALQISEFYAWQFLGAPENGGKDWNCVAVRGSDILGVMGLNRRAFYLRGKRIEGAELTTWVVSEAARGFGVGRDIMNSLQEEYSYLTGLGISEAAMPIYMTSGFRHLARIPRYFRILDLEAVRDYSKIERLGERLSGAWSEELTNFKSSIASPADLAALQGMLSDHANHYIRDEAALRWRFLQHPTYKYEFHIVHNSAVPGRGVAVIYRIDDMAKALHVVDIFGDSADLSAAISFIETVGRSQKVSFVDIYLTHSATASFFLAAGWFSVTDDDFFHLPHLFYPLELRRPSTTSLVSWSRNHRAEAFDFGRLHVTKGDLDLDRPTLAFYDMHGLPV